MSATPEPAEAPPSSRYHVEPYGNRAWALYDGGELLAVTVYKKGATSVQRALEARDAVIAEQAARIEQLTGAVYATSAPGPQRFQDRVRPDRAEVGSVSAERKESYAARQRRSGKGR
jgi:hypothetical protein